MIQEIPADTRDTSPPEAAGRDELDAALILEVIRGSHDALAALYDRHANAVFRAAMRVNADAAFASDIVQETFLLLWDRAEQFDPSRGRLGTWLAAIARNRSVDHIRAAARHDRAATFSSFTAPGWDDSSSVAERLTWTGALVAAAEPEVSPESAASMDDCREWISGVIGSLGPLERRVIGLAYAEGLSQSEIAGVLDWPIGTVKTRTRRALRRLRDSMDGPTMMATPCA
jgi:RNA polymerase sigma-70 factor, ECF subfamily